MALTESAMPALGSAAHDFNLLEPLSKQQRSFGEIKGEQGTVVMFICNHCPYVIHIESGLIQFGRDYKESGIGIVAICANDAETYPADGPDKIAAQALGHGYPFPYLYDETQEVAKNYQAACTPDFFLFNEKDELIYRGRFDNASPGRAYPVTGFDLRSACDALLKGEPLPEPQLPSSGCSIKWKNDN